MRKALPKIEALPGSLHVQRVKCGKSNCRCARGEGHAAYYRFWREDGRLRKAYVRRVDLDGVRAGLALWRKCRANHKALVSGRDLADVLRQQRETMRSAGLEPPRKMYGPKVERDESPRIEETLGGLVTLSLPNFRFG